MFSLLLALIYLSFISLGLPDALLGSAWPAMQVQFDVPVSYMGIVAALISACTVVSSLMADRINRRFGTARVTAVSTGMTALALLGFGLSTEFWHLILLAIPYGLGAGSIDAALNNYVAIHYESRHMSWLHCMWGIGASAGPFIMGFALSGGQTWNLGYICIAIIQAVLTVALVLTQPLWKMTGGKEGEKPQGKPLPLRSIIRITGAKEVMTTFFCYCALELTAGQWASSYFVLKDGLSADEAAGYASLFYIGITAGRAISGFAAMKLNDQQLIRLGQSIIALGIVLMLMPFGKYATVCGLLCIGVGCAPIYPCMIHSTPEHFGTENSQAVIGVQMAGAYVGNCLMPPLFGVLADLAGVWLLPLYLLGILFVMFLMHERLNRVCAQNRVKT